MPNEQKNLSKKSFKKETKKALLNILETEDSYIKPDEIMVKFKHGKLLIQNQKSNEHTINYYNHLSQW